MINGLEQNHVLAPYAHLITPLLEDYFALLEAKRAKDAQYLRRAIVKAFFSFVEGAIQIGKDMLLAYRSSAFSPDEIVALKEASIRLNENGYIHAQDYFPKVQDNLMFMIRMIQKGAAEPHLVDKNSHEWQSFIRLVKIRHQITHPKVDGDLSISDAAILDLEFSLSWLIDLAANVAFACLGKDNIRTKPLRLCWAFMVDLIVIHLYDTFLEAFEQPSARRVIEHAIVAIATEMNNIQNAVASLSPAFSVSLDPLRAFIPVSSSLQKLDENQLVAHKVLIINSLGDGFTVVRWLKSFARWRDRALQGCEVTSFQLILPGGT